MSLSEKKMCHVVLMPRRSNTCPPCRPKPRTQSLVPNLPFRCSLVSRCRPSCERGRWSGPYRPACVALSPTPTSFLEIRWCRGAPCGAGPLGGPLSFLGLRTSPPAPLAAAPPEHCFLVPQTFLSVGKTIVGGGAGQSQCLITAFLCPLPFWF